MKLNWGTGIALFYGTFVVVLVAVVIKTTTFDNSLVSEQYYADDLNYQQQYNKLANSISLPNDLTVSMQAAAQQVELLFPAEAGQASGEIYFYNPSYKAGDFRVAIQPDSDHRQIISTAELRPGLWRVKVDWQAGGKSYFKEVVITI